MNTKEFYDDFLDKRMAGYIVDGNARIEAAVNFSNKVLPSNINSALDFGCGIGYFSSKFSAMRPSVQMLSVDAGPRNIKFAKKMFSSDKIQFHEFDGLSESAIREFLKTNFSSSSLDVIFLIDVIEHIPKEARKEFFKSTRLCVGSDCHLVLTFPSPDYQKYLQNHNPSELQFIDEVVEPAELVVECENAGWMLKSIQYVDVWNTNQYLHAHFIAQRELKKYEVSFSFRKKIFRKFDMIFGKRIRKQKVKEALENME